MVHTWEVARVFKPLKKQLKVFAHEWFQTLFFERQELKIGGFEGSSAPPITMSQALNVWLWYEPYFEERHTNQHLWKIPHMVQKLLTRGIGEGGADFSALLQCFHEFQVVLCGFSSTRGSHLWQNVYRHLLQTVSSFVVILNCAQNIQIFKL